MVLPFGQIWADMIYRNEDIPEHRMESIVDAWTSLWDAVAIVTCFVLFYVVYCSWKSCKKYRRKYATASAHHSRPLRTPNVQVIRYTRRDGRSSGEYRCVFGPQSSHPEADSVFNISGRVQQEHRQWPTHDGRIPVDHLSISNELNNKYNDDPPSYEEAMRLALAASTNPSNDVVPPLVAPTPTSATPGAATTTEAEAPKP